MLDEAEGVLVGIAEVHLAVAPGLVVGLKLEGDAVGGELGMERIDIAHVEGGDSASDAIAGEGGEVERDAIALETEIRRVRRGGGRDVGPVLGEAELAAVVGFGGFCRGDVEEGDGLEEICGGHGDWLSALGSRFSVTVDWVWRGDKRVDPHQGGA